MASPALTLSSLNAVVFGVYGPCVRRLDSDKILHHFWAGTVAGFVQSPLSCVVELTKVRVQMQGVGETAKHEKLKHYSGSINAFFKILKTEGVAGCFRGLCVVLLRDSLGYGVYFMSYEGLCRLLGKSSSKELPILSLMFAGGLSGMISWASVYYLDIIKTRYQVDGIGGIKKYSSYSDIIKKIYHHKGLQGFFAGFSITMVRAFPSNAIIFGGVSLTYHILR